MGSGFDMTYQPEKSVVSIYARRYEKYLAFGNDLDKEKVIQDERVLSINP